MPTQLPLFPEQASTVAQAVDHLYFFLVAISLFFATLIFVLVFYFAIRYRRRRADEIPRPILGSLKLELFWSIVPGIIAMGIFGWGASVYFRIAYPPPDAMEIFVVGKQWMWKIQHPEGQREINELHVPVGRPVKLTMATEDVIHSFYIPAFRVKMDVVPGRYTSLWFEATKTGEYHMFCAEYCGTQHSAMIGTVYVLDPVDFENWLSGAATGETMAGAGEKLFERLGCNSCHTPDTTARGPALDGLFGSTVLLATGQRVTADEDYIRESILRPNAKVVAGYRPVMPTFEGQVTEEQLLQLIAYIQTLGSQRRTEAE